MIRTESLSIDTMPCLPGMEDLLPTLDNDVILDGSLAKWGYCVGDAKGEVFLHETRTKSVLTVYPLDGKDRPVEVELKRFDHTDAEVLGAIKLALEHRAISRLNK